MKSCSISRKSDKQATWKKLWFLEEKRRELIFFCYKTGCVKTTLKLIYAGTFKFFATSTLVGNVVNISATCHHDTCHSHIFDDIFNVADTVTESQSWSRVGKIPRHDICKASLKLVCQQWTSLPVTCGMVMLPTHQQTSSQHVTTLVMVTWHVSKNWGLLTRHDTDNSN